MTAPDNCRPLKSHDGHGWKCHIPPTGCGWVLFGVKAVLCGAFQLLRGTKEFSNQIERTLPSYLPNALGKLCQTQQISFILGTYPQLANTSLGVELMWRRSIWIVKYLESSWWLTALLQVGFSQIKPEWLQDSAVPKALSALMWKSFGEPQTKDILFIRLRRREQMEQGKLVVDDLVISYQIYL